MHRSVFSCTEQAYFYHKAIICEREDIAVRLKEMDDPAKIKHKGDRIDTCDTWEKTKEGVMRNVLLQKFVQNPELKTKLLSTSGLPLLECTNNRYWGTGWFLDDQQWNETVNYPGKNVLGVMLGEIRDSFDLDVLNSTEVIKGLEVMETETTAEERTIVPDDRPPAVQEKTTTGSKTPLLAEGRVAFASVKKAKEIMPSAREMLHGPYQNTRSQVHGPPI